jgi:intein-encoded DNA endonuclease-like protein
MADELCKCETTLTPSPELSYIIGVVLGDGSCIKAKNHSYRIRLAATDRSFVQAFNQNICKILMRREYPIWMEKCRHQNRKPLWIAVAYSKMLYDFLHKKELEKFKPIVERYPAEFIRGFYDSEGSLDCRGVISIRNKSLEILQYIHDLLWRRFKISSSLYETSYRNMKTLAITRRKECIKFLVAVGSNIERKSLKSYLSRFKLTSSSLVDCECTYCGKRFKRRKSRLKYKLGLRRHFFCTRACWYEWNKEKGWKNLIALGFKKGQKPLFGFPKGHIPWNKGRKTNV